MEYKNVKEDKKPLNIYVYLDINESNDLNVIYKCIEVFIKVNIKEHYVDKYVIINSNRLRNVEYTDNEKMENNKINKIQDDVVQKSLIYMKNIIHNEKLKTANECWFISISNGNIKNIYKDVCLFLINKNPKKQECFYTIYKNKLDINKALDKTDKIKSLKVITNSLTELLKSNKIIKY